MMRRRYGWLVVALLGVAVAATAWAALTPVETGSKEQVYVIPKGTFARRMAGENIDILPSEIHLTIGINDVLVLKNHDDVPQLFGPVLIMPEQSFRLPVGKAASYLFTCPMHTSGLLTVVVDPEPERGWSRLL